MGVSRTSAGSHAATSPGCIAGEHGFALPLVILLIALLTVLLTAELSRATAEYQIAMAHEAVAEARAVAQSGLQTYLGAVGFDACDRPVRPADGDSVRINVPGGYAEVVARVVRRPADSLANWLYVVRSAGYVIWPSAGATPVATRTVAQFAEWQSGSLDLPAAFTAANGLNRIGGGTGQFHGSDEHAVSACQTSPRRSLRVSGGVPDLVDYDLTGDSPLGFGSGSSIVTDARIDWGTTLTPGRIMPDFTTPQPDDGTYPVVLVMGDATFGTAGATTFGRGLLIVSGDLTILGSFVQFYGVVLVGGEIHFDAADQRFDGLVASGLNRQLGMFVPDGTFGGDYTDIDYNSQYVFLAMRALAGFAPVANAHIEDWKTY